MFSTHSTCPARQFFYCQSEICCTKKHWALNFFARRRLGHKCAYILIIHSFPNYFVLRWLNEELPSTTLYHKVCTKHLPGPLRIAAVISDRAQCAHRVHQVHPIHLQRTECTECTECTKRTCSKSSAPSTPSTLSGV